MIFLIAFVALHILCWGTVGAVLAPRAGVPVVVGAALSVLLPVVGSLVLAGMAVWGANGAPAYQHHGGWLRTGWIGVVGGMVVALSAFLPWVEVGVSGEIGAVDEDLVSFAAADFVALPLTLAISGLSMAAFAWFSLRRGNREWLVGTATFAWLPAFLGSTLVLTEGFIDSWVGRANSVGDVLSEQDVVDTGVAADYQIGAGSYAALIGGVTVLVWGFVWSLRRADSVVPLAASRGFTWALPRRSGEARVGTGVPTGALAGAELAGADDWAGQPVSADPGALASHAVADEWAEPSNEWADDSDFRDDGDGDSGRWW